MRFLLDECVPAEAKDFLESLGHEVRTVSQEGCSGAANGEVHRPALNRFNFLVTTDRHFRTPLKFPPGPATGILYVRVRPLLPELVVAALDSFSRVARWEDAAGRKVILRARDHEFVA